jgi:hypothetical protein
VVQPTRASTLHQVERVTVCETSKIWGRFRVPQGAADRAEADRGRQAGRQAGRYVNSSYMYIAASTNPTLLLIYNPQWDTL